MAIRLRARLLSVHGGPVPATAQAGDAMNNKADDSTAAASADGCVSDWQAMSADQAGPIGLESAAILA
jgi:hypothetical protein